MGLDSPAVERCQPPRCCSRWGCERAGDQGHREEFPFWRWKIPGPLLEKSRKFPFRINDLFTSKRVH